jgi:hypothetical protein
MYVHRYGEVGGEGGVEGDLTVLVLVDENTSR